MGMELPEGRIVHSIGDAYHVVEEDGQGTIRCSKCGFSFCDRTDDPKLAAVVAERSIVEASPLNAHGAVEDLVLREFYCPGCGAMVGANVQRVGDPVLREMNLA